MTSTASLCQILDGLRNVSFNTMESHWKTIPTLQHNKKEVGTRNHWKLLNAEGVQGPLNQRSDVKEAKQTCKSLYHEHIQLSLEVETNLSLQSNRSGKGSTNSLKT